MRAMMFAIGSAVAKDRRAVTSIEYGIIGAFVFLIIIGGLSAVGTKLSPIFTTISSGL